MHIQNITNYIFFCFFLCILGMLAYLRAETIHSSFFDLGIFENHFYQIVFEGSWQRIFFGHVQPLMFLEAQGYRFSSSFYYLIIMQTFFLSLPVLLIPGITKEMGNEKSFISTLGYILFFAVWYNGLFDFHMDHLAVSFGFIFYLTVFKKKWGLACLTGILTALVKEPFAVVTIFFGIYIVAKYRFTEGIKPVFAAVFLFFFGAVYFYIATYILSPTYTSGIRSGLDSSAFSWMGDNITEIITYLLMHPVQTIKEIFFTPGKMIYLAVLFGSLAFIPFLAPIELIPAIPILGISLLSRLDNYYGIGHHYTAGLIAPLIVAFIAGLPRAEKLWLKTGFSSKSFYVFLVFIFLLANILISPSPISRLFWTNKIWNYGYEAYTPTERNRIIKKAILKHIPSDPEIFVSTQNTLNTSHLARRRFYLPFPNAITEPILFQDMNNPNRTFKKSADFVLLDLKRPIFLMDQGCDYIYGKCQNKEIKNKYYKIIEEMKLRYNNIYEYDGFSIWKRNN